MDNIKFTIKSNGCELVNPDSSSSDSSQHGHSRALFSRRSSRALSGGKKTKSCTKVCKSYRCNCVCVSSVQRQGGKIVCNKDYESHIVVGVTRQNEEYLGQAVLVVDHGSHKNDAETYIEQWRGVDYAKTEIFEPYGARCAVDRQLSWPTSGPVTIAGQSVHRKLAMAWDTGYTLEYWGIFGWLGLEFVGLVIVVIACAPSRLQISVVQGTYDMKMLSLHFAFWFGTMLPLLLLLIRTDPTISHQGKSGLLIALVVVTALGWLPITCMMIWPGIKSFLNFREGPVRRRAKDPSTAIAIEMKPQTVTDDGVKVTEVIVTEE